MSPRLDLLTIEPTPNCTPPAKFVDEAWRRPGFADAPISEIDLSCDWKTLWARPVPVGDLPYFGGRGAERHQRRAAALSGDIARGDQPGASLDAERWNRRAADAALQARVRKERDAADRWALDDEADADEYEAALREAAFASKSQRALDLLAALPSPWRMTVLRRQGGTGAESVEDLELALSPEPDKRFSVCRAHDAWAAVRHLRPVAARVHDMVSPLRCVDQAALPLLCHTDAELLDVAERIGQSIRARHAHRVARGETGIHPRERSAVAIRRRLRRRVGRAAIHAAGILGLIGGPQQTGRSGYVDDWTLGRWRGNRAKSAEWLNGKMIVDLKRPDVRLPLGEVAKGKAGTRRAMWYAIVLGMREHARRQNDRLERHAARMRAQGDYDGAERTLSEALVPLFPTGTLPPSWHPNPTKGESSYDPANSPDAGVRELGARWHRAMALMRETGIPKFGLRTLEPHGDGAAHLHAVLYVRRCDVTEVKRILGLQWPSTTEEEAAARSRGCYPGPALKVKDWEHRTQDDGRVADPATYVMTYVLKGLDSDGTGSPDALASQSSADHDRAVSEGERAAAWASSVGVRRISLVGLAPGTIGRWEALQKALRSGEPQSCPRARTIIHAMRRAQWSTVLVLLGAFDLKPPKRKRPEWQPRLAAWRDTRVDCWGDAVQETAGYFHPGTGEIIAVRRPVKWMVMDADGTAETQALSVVVSDPRNGPPVHPAVRPLPTAPPPTATAPIDSTSGPH